MRVIHYGSSQLGLVIDGEVIDVTDFVKALPVRTWPYPPGDPLIESLGRLQTHEASSEHMMPRVSLAAVQARSPVPWPGKVMAAIGNYRAHLDDALDPEVDAGVHRAEVEGVDAPTEKLGLFLKASSSVVGPSQGIPINWPDRRNDFEVELAVVIGATCRDVSQDRALDYVAGYCVGIDVSCRGVEDRSFRKSADGYTVLGPWLTTADEIPDPQALEIWLEVNGVERQRSSSSKMIVGVRRLLEIASSTYTLYPGDVLMTGTPEAVGQLHSGDVIRAGADGLGVMEVVVRERD